jgi:hypothetical protein
LSVSSAFFSAANAGDGCVQKTPTCRNRHFYNNDIKEHGMNPQRISLTSSHFKQRTLALSIGMLFGATALPVHAQSAQDFKEMRAEIKRLHDELSDLKKSMQSVVAAAPATAPVPAPAPVSAPANLELAERIEQVELRARDAVVVGDIPNSYRLPNSETSMRLYGFAELTAVHEMKGDNADQDYSTFLPYAPLNGSSQARRNGRSYLTARTSRLGIETSTPTRYGALGIKIEGDFNNDPRTGNAAVSGNIGNIYTQQSTNSYNFRLRHAYAQVGGLLIGQTWSTFMDVDNAPETVDFNGPIGATFIRQPQVRYAYPTASMGTFTAALENPVSYVLEGAGDNAGSPSTKGFSRQPDLIARWDKAFDFGAVSVRGLTHEHKLDDGAMSTAKRGYGLAASGLVKTVGDDFLTWGITGGSGIGRYFNYIEGALYDAQNHRIVTEKTLGLLLGYQHKASATLRYNASVGAQRTFNNDYTAYAMAQGLDSGRFGVNRQVVQAHLGFIWNPVKGVDLGAEYIHGQRKTLADETGNMSRVNLSAKVNFN